jgi:hypothetical protein
MVVQEVLLLLEQAVVVEVVGRLETEVMQLVDVGAAVEQGQVAQVTVVMLVQQQLRVPPHVVIMQEFHPRIIIMVQVPLGVQELVPNKMVRMVMQAM